MSSGIQVDRGTPATVQRSSLTVYRTSIHNLLTLARSCRTPSGHMKILQNTTGGSLTLTSSSKRLFPSLSIKKPIIQLLVTAAQGHLGAYSDGGLFIITFATDLVLKSLDSSQNVKIVAEIYEKLLFICLNYMRSEVCKFKYNAKVSDIRFMTNFVKSVILTKPLCCLYDFNLDHISKLVLETFVQSVSDSDQCLTVSDAVFSICTAGYTVTESRVVEGLLLLAPEFSRFRASDIKPKYVNHNSRRHIKVAMVTVSLSGDLEELSAIDIEISGNVSMDTVILEDLSGFCDSLIQSEVGLVLCQKVVHPKLKLSLQSAGVVVVDRLGIQPVKFVTTLTECVPISTIDPMVSQSYFGYLDDICHTIVNKKSYLQLTRKDNPVSTMLLYHQQDQALLELNDVCMTSLEGLHQLLYTPAVLAGAGCWQMGLAMYLMSKVQSDLQELSCELECPVKIVWEATSLFCQALLTAANINTSYQTVSRLSGHVFQGQIQPDTIKEGDHCCCGIYTVVKVEELIPLTDLLDNFTVECIDNSVNERCQPLSESVLDSRRVVLDGSTMCLNALQTAVLSACSVLKIGQVVENI